MGAAVGLAVQALDVDHPDHLQALRGPGWPWSDQLGPGGELLRGQERDVHRPVGVDLDPQARSTASANSALIEDSSKSIRAFCSSKLPR